MSKPDAQQALDIYKRFCAHTEKIVAYMQTAKKLSSTLGLNVPNLRHAPISLAGALKEYLDDPNFEKNRIEYKENKRVADGHPRSKPTPASATSAEKAPPKSIKIQEPSASEKEKPLKPPVANQAVQDFFESIESNQNQMSMFDPNQQQAFMMPQMTGAPPPMMMPQMTGYNPFFMQQQPTGFAQQPTGFPQQPTGFLQQPTGFPQQSTSGFLNPQATGFNPFRQSVMPQATGFPSFGSGPAASFSQPSQHIPAPTSQSNALDSFNSAFDTPVTQASSTPNAGQSSTKQSADSFSTPKPLTAQKTGSRNPFAPPPGSTPPPVPSPPSSKGPTLYELAFGSTSGSTGPTAGGGGSYGLGAGAWSGNQQQPHQVDKNVDSLVPQKTGMIGSVASEFVKGQPSTASASPGVSSPQPTGATPNSQAFQSTFSNLSIGENPSVNVSTPSPLQPQPTGFGGSQVRPFKPESTFGVSLAANNGQIPSPIPAHLTGNPFAKQESGHSSPLGVQTTSTPTTSLAPSQSHVQPALTGVHGPFSAQQGTSFGNLTVGSQPAASGVGATQSMGNNNTPLHLSAQSTGFGSSLFPSNGTSSPANLAPQPTGFGGSTVKPFQPSSAFGTAAFSPQPESQQQQQQSAQASVPTGAFF